MKLKTVINDKTGIERKNFIWNFLGLTFNSFNSLFYLIIVNRINGSHDGGIFTFAFSLISLFYFLGIYYSRAYQISNEKYNDKELFLNRVISCFVMLLVSLIYCKTMNYNDYKSLIILLICLFRLSEAFADVFYGMEHKDGVLYKAGKSMFYKSVFSVLGFFIVDYLFKNLVISIFIVIIINIIGIIFYDLKNAKKYLKDSYKLSNILSIYKATLPIFAFSFLSLYLVNCSKYSLDYYSNAEMQNVFGIILMPGTIISLFSSYIVNPYMVRLNESNKKKDIKSFKNLILKLSLFIFLFGLVCEVGAYFLGIPILNLLYGLNLSPYKFDLLIVIFGAVFLALVSVLSAALTIIGRNYIQMIIYIINSIISFILANYLVSRYYILGASLEYMFIMISQYILYLVAYCYYCNRYLLINSRKSNI